MSKILKYSTFLLLSFLATGCAVEDWGSFFLPNRGEVIFKASTSFRNGGDGDGQTKTVYSGERGSLTMNDGTESKYERIDWTVGDKIQVYCNQANPPQGSSNCFAEYQVNSNTPDGTVKKNDKATVTPVTDGNGKVNGLRWSDATTDHHFFAVYPSPATATGDKKLTLTIGEGITGDTGDDIAVVAGKVPQTQKVVKVQTITRKTSSGDQRQVTEYFPDMDYVAMAAYSKQKGYGTEVPLYFKPLVTTIRFELLREDNNDLDGYKLMGLRLSSEDEDANTTATDPEGNESQILVKAGRLHGDYKVAFGKYSSHNAPTAADPTATPQTFRDGRGINDNVHDVDGQDNAFATIDATLTGETPSHPFSKADNYVEIIPDGTFFPSTGIDLDATTPVAFTFICSPMTLTQLSLTLTFQKGSTVITRTLKLQHRTSWIDIHERYKTYFDAVQVHPRGYRIVVTPLVMDFPNQATQTESYFSVASYRDDGIPVNWTATFSEEGDLFSHYKADPPAWIASFFQKDGGSNWGDRTNYQNVIGNDESALKYYNVSVSENAPFSWSLNAATEEPAEGCGTTTKEKAPDLSYRDIYGKDFMTRETANCYVVSGQGYYKFPAVYGNAIMNGSDNSAAYHYTGNPSDQISEYPDNILNTFLRHDGGEIANPWIKKNNIAIASANVLWQDTPGLLNNVSYLDGDGEDDEFIYFRVNANIEGNAVIVAKDAGGTVVWSWHIWVVHDPQNELSTVQLDINHARFNSPVDHNHVMHNNLGYTQTAGSSAPIRVCHVKFKQLEADGDSTTIVITQLGTDKGATTLYYQWGRKDPMFPSRWADDNLGYIRNSRIYKEGTDFFDSNKENPNPSTQSCDAIPAGQNGVAYAIQHPEIMFTGPNKNPGKPKSWCGTDFYFNLWNSAVSRPVRRIGNNSSSNADNDDFNFSRSDLAVTKTVYDPCPPGFVVPNEFAFSIFSIYKWTGSQHTGGEYPGTLFSNLNIEGTSEADKKQRFNNQLGHVFYTTQSSSHTKGRVLMNSCGRREGNHQDNASSVAQLKNIPTKANPESGYGLYWTAQPYLTVGQNVFTYGRTFRFLRVSINVVIGNGDTGSNSGMLCSHAQPVRPVWDLNSSRNPTDHGHL